jgi:hypothetical protein
MWKRLEVVEGAERKKKGLEPSCRWWFSFAFKLYGG